MERVDFMCGLDTQSKAKNDLSARSHGASVTAIGLTIMGVTDTCYTKWVQDPFLTQFAVAVAPCE